MLNSSDSPDIGQIEAREPEVQEMRGDKRIGFTPEVGEAARCFRTNNVRH